MTESGWTNVSAKRANFNILKEWNDHLELQYVIISNGKNMVQNYETWKQAVK